MQSRLRQVQAFVVPGILAATVLTLGLQNRSLRERERDLVMRYTHPHKGVLLPPFRAATLRGDSVTIGELAHEGRQVLFFFTTKCPYCRASWPAIAKIDSEIKRNTVMRAQLIAIALESGVAVNR